MRAHKSSCEITLCVFQHNLKIFQSFQKTRKVISSTNIKEMEKKMPNFDLEFGYLFSSEPEKEKQMKEKPHCFACVDGRKLDNLITGAQAKMTKYAIE